MSLCVWPFIDSAPGHHTDMRPVSLEPARPEGAPLGKTFAEKWPVAKLPKSYQCLLMGNFFSNAIKSL